MNSGRWTREEITEALSEGASNPSCPPSTVHRPLHLSIHSLSLSHFRNHAALRLEPCGENVILIGPNGAGKTNILEAISLLTPGRGLRRAKLSELDMQHAARAWTVAARVEGMLGEAQIGTGRGDEMESDRRVIRIDGAEMKSPNALADHMAILWLTPQMDQMWSEGESAKRRFLDRLAYTFDAQHAARVSAYEYAMRERNKLLQNGWADAHWLSALEHKMAETATAMTLARLQTVESLTHMMQESALSFPKAELRLSGFLEEHFQAGDAALSVEQKYAEKLAENRKLDAAAGRTQTGPHRSLLAIRHIGKNMEAEFCSTGEQKALLLSLILAQARACARWKSLLPVLLLDEVAAHLDEGRRQELFEELQDLQAQSWMTGTDKDLFKHLHDKVILFHVGKE